MWQICKHLLICRYLPTVMLEPLELKKLKIFARLPIHRNIYITAQSNLKSEITEKFKQEGLKSWQTALVKPTWYSRPCSCHQRLGQHICLWGQEPGWAHQCPQ